ncbi:MAG TPA: hypothetical protein VL899_07810 [Alphaproteobacteria bacterium]|jgi:hypothetical protein|nr:hypothetical protein [Alphaproteobacteria bacterium]
MGVVMPWWLPILKRNYRREGYSPEESSVVRWTSILSMLIFLPSLFVLTKWIVGRCGPNVMHSLWPVVPLLLLYVASACISGLLLKIFAPVLFNTADSNAKRRLSEGAAGKR